MVQNTRLGLKTLPARFFRLETGREPVRDWLLALDEADRKAVGDDIRDCGASAKGAERMTEDTKTQGIEKGRVGSSFEGFLKQQGRFEETTNTAVKRVLARQIAEAMAERRLTKSAMARRMGTSRSQLDRLLDPTNDHVTLATLRRAAEVVGRKIRLALV